MQAVILAAGMGNRLGKYTKDNTKCMLSINGRTLIERSLDALDAAGIRKCVIVAGYKRENLIAFAGHRHGNMDIHYVVNEIYDKTNNIYSLYLAKDFLLEDDTLLLESDLIFEPALLTGMIADPAPSIAAVAPFESWMDGTVVQLAPDHTIVCFIPKALFNFKETASYYKTVNIYKFSKDFLRKTYVPFLEAYSKAMGANEYYEQVLRVITTLDKHELKGFILDKQKWYEIDDVQDKNIAETIFSSSPEEHLARIQASYGGYWRFPRMLDFCYLVNPYFPTKQMYREMKASFKELITRYPSSLKIENLLAGKLFNVEADNILTGNGAAELIRAIAPLLEGSIGVIYPTFNEYPESFGGKKLIPFVPDGFRYTKEDLVKFSGACDTLVLINPDNPSGNCISPADIIELLDTLKEQGKKLILDESFIDFCGMEGSGTLIRQQILDAYPNLVIIKSLSKSYGVPGIRLGVMASGSRELIQKARAHIPIWNINSFGEYFLQIIGKYTKDYRISCSKINTERNRFKSLLEETGWLAVYPSQANYFLCRLKGPRGAHELSTGLLEEYNILIKDLTGKKGIPDDRHVRIAILNENHNDQFAAALKDFYTRHST